MLLRHTGALWSEVRIEFRGLLAPSLPPLCTIEDRQQLGAKRRRVKRATRSDYWPVQELWLERKSKRRQAAAETHLDKDKWRPAEKYTRQRPRHHSGPTGSHRFFSSFLRLLVEGIRGKHPTRDSMSLFFVPKLHFTLKMS